MGIIYSYDVKPTSNLKIYRLSQQSILGNLSYSKYDKVLINIYATILGFESGFKCYRNVYQRNIQYHTLKKMVNYLRPRFSTGNAFAILPISDKFEVDGISVNYITYLSLEKTVRHFKKLQHNRRIKL